MHGVAHDHQRAGRKLLTASLARPRQGDRRQTVAVGRVVAKRSEREIPVEPGRLELHPGTALDVAGQQSERDPRLRREPLEEFGDPRFRHHGFRPEPHAELLDVPVQNLGKRRVESSDADGFDHELSEDLGVRLSREVDPVGGSFPAEHCGERRQDRLARGEARGKEGTVHVEEDDAVLPVGIPSQSAVIPSQSAVIPSEARDPSVLRTSG